MQNPGECGHREENLQSMDTHPHPEPTVTLESADDANLTPHVQKAADTAGTN